MILRLALASFLLVAVLSRSLADEDELFKQWDLEAETSESKRAQVLTNTWALRLEPGHGQNPDELADDIAKQFGMVNRGVIGNLEHYYELEYKGGGRSRRSLLEHTKRIAEHPNIKWVQQQELLERYKRSPVKREEDFNDPHYPRQWYIHNHNDICKVVNITANFDLNITSAWNQGYTGKGIVVAVVDDGVDHRHPDLKRNYDPKASIDLNGGDEDPIPDDSDPYNGHGTKCAGEIGAEAGNGECGVGVAFDVNLGGIRVLDGSVTDALESKALGFKNDYIDIYSNCWGPKDDGKTFGRPGEMATASLKNGAEKGRNGKGVIYVWATGNGGGANDDCNCDGYTTNIHTISVGAVSCYGLSTFYDELCSSTLAVTYTSGYHNPSDVYQEMPLVTTSLHNQCTESFQGTSSAAPIAAGIIALTLEANPNLGWRDVQHLIVHTSRVTSQEDAGWHRNGAGFMINHKFGFGLMDAGAMVDMAKTWKNVGKHLKLDQEPDEENSHGDIPGGGKLILKLKTDGKGKDEDGTFVIKKLEHVQVTVSFKNRRRGDISIQLVSPSGTVSDLLSTRLYDRQETALDDWTFSTVHCWGEDPRGEWTLKIRDNPDTEKNTLNKKNDIEETERENIEEAIRKAHRKKDYIIRPGNYAYNVVPNEYVRDEVHHGRSKDEYMKDRREEQEEKKKLNPADEFLKREEEDERWEKELQKERDLYEKRRREKESTKKAADSIARMKEAFKRREALDRRIEKYLTQLKKDDYSKSNEEVKNYKRDYDSQDYVGEGADSFYFTYYDAQKRASGFFRGWKITFYGTG